MENKEIEVRFLEIDKKLIAEKLKKLGAVDEGENMLTETIFYDTEGKFIEDHKYIRLRENKNKTTLTYKHHTSKGAKIDSAEDTTEIEFTVSDSQKAGQFLKELGLVAVREQEKLRHTFKLKNTTLDIDTWPSIPPYIEIEGPSEKEIRLVSEELGLDWKNAFFHSAREILEQYNIPITKLKSFTFKKIE